MKRIALNITLKDPLVLSANNVTSGLPQSLDYIPGAAILGALAATHYKTFAQKGLATTVFHSGEVRFHNAYASLEGKETYPVALSWHYNKMGEKNRLFNLLQQSLPEEGQPKQIRKGYFSSDGRRLNLTKTVHLRTAIDPLQSTAAESQLFAYEAIEEGVTMRAYIDCESEETAQAVYDAVQEKRQWRIGRSRSAHYGRVSVTAEAPQTFQEEDYALLQDGYLYLWLASDLAVYNQFGQPSLMPSLKDLGLSSADIKPEKQFVRHRTYSPYNGYRKSYDLERQVLQQGSVLRYEAKELYNNWQQIVAQGLGAYREAGLGQVVPLGKAQWLELITRNEIQSKGDKFDGMQPQTPQNATETALMKWLSAQSEEAKFKPAVNQFVQEWMKKLCTKIESVRRYNGLSGQPVGPTKTQWGHLRNLVTRNNFTSAEELITALKDDRDGIMKSKDEKWTQADNEGSFAQFIKKVVNEAAKKSEGNEHRLHLLIRAFARAVAQSSCLQKVQQGTATCGQCQFEKESQA